MKNKKVLYWLITAVAGTVIGYVVREYLDDRKKLKEELDTEKKVDPEKVIYNDENIEL